MRITGSFQLASQLHCDIPYTTFLEEHRLAIQAGCPCVGLILMFGSSAAMNEFNRRRIVPCFTSPRMRQFLLNMFLRKTSLLLLFVAIVSIGFLPAFAQS